MDDYEDSLMEVLALSQLGMFWELRAARLSGTAEGDLAAQQADAYAPMLTTEVVVSLDEPRPERMLS